ncbi:MAG: hypothetical protein KJ666_17185 [Bacteroidetes bacterium]|nr:hypothetical protein [Bacteroidota bacterium]
MLNSNQKYFVRNDIRHPLANGGGCHFSLITEVTQTCRHVNSYEAGGAGCIERTAQKF